MRRLAVLVPVRDGGAAFRACLEGLKALGPQPDEIVVVDDASRDDSGDAAAQRGCRVIRLERGVGPAAARNLAARSTNAEILFFVDADVVVPPDAVARVLAAFAAADAPDALFGSYDDAPAAPSRLSQYRNLLHHYVHQTSHTRASTFWAACGAIRREIFVGAGGFDERYTTPSIEDIELGHRLTGSGFSIRLLKDLQVKHLKRWTPATLVRTDFERRALPWSRLILRSRRTPNDLNLRTSMRLSVLAAFVILAALVAAPWRFDAWKAGAVGALALLALNAPFYSFLLRKRGVLLLMNALPWHWLHYLISGAGFGWALVERFGQRRE